MKLRQGQRRERDRIKAIQKEKQLKEDIASFYNRMERFFGMEIKGDGITIRPLEGVTQFYKEGKACTIVYTPTGITDAVNA